MNESVSSRCPTQSITSSKSSSVPALDVLYGDHGFSPTGGQNCALVRNFINVVAHNVTLCTGEILLSSFRARRAFKGRIEAVIEAILSQKLFIFMFILMRTLEC